MRTCLHVDVPDGDSEEDSDEEGRERDGDDGGEVESPLQSPAGVAARAPGGCSEGERGTGGETGRVVVI